MAKCPGCGKFLSKGGAACSKCTLECRGKVPSTLAKGTGSGEYVLDSAQSPQIDLGFEIRSFRSELREVRDELREFRREMADLHISVAECNKRVDGLESRLEVLESKPVVASPEGEISQLERTIAHLKLELNDRDQESLSSDLEIANLPEDSGENTIHVVGLVAAKLGMVLDERDIVFAERVGARTRPSEAQSSVVAATAATTAGGARCRRIVVRLARRQLCDELLKSARVRRGATSADLGFAAPARRFYLNERLTKSNKQLFHRARDVSRGLGWKYVWTKRGRVFARECDGKPAHQIRSEGDLGRVFGCEAVGEKNN